MKRHLNPPSLPANPAFSQVVVVEQPSQTIYVGGQNAVDVDGNIVGDDLHQQTRQALRNLRAALAAADASFADVVRWTVTIVEGHEVLDGFRAFQQLDDIPDPPPAIGVAVVAGLANPGFLVEIDAVAVR